MNKVFGVLKAGNTVENPEFWKKVQLYVTIAGSFVPVLAVFVPVFQVIIDKDVIAHTLSAVAAVNVYLTMATTTKIGI
jgi:hypothetical protein